MELKGFLSVQEQAILSTDQVEVTSEDAFHLLMQASELLSRNGERLFVNNRGQTAGERSELNTAYHAVTTLQDLIAGLERLSGAQKQPK